MIQAANIGLGAIGQRLIKDFTSHPNIKVTAICDQNEEMERRKNRDY